MDDSSSPKQRTWLGQIAIVLVGVVVILWFMQARKAPLQLLERRDCENRYAAARTAVDTLAVDSQRPLDSQRPDTLPLTCGALRRAGVL
jgi:hypothetical protein